MIILSDKIIMGNIGKRSVPMTFDDNNSRNITICEIIITEIYCSNFFLKSNEEVGEALQVFFKLGKLIFFY